MKINKLIIIISDDIITYRPSIGTCMVQSTVGIFKRNIKKTIEPLLFMTLYQRV